MGWVGRRYHEDSTLFVYMWYISVPSLYPDQCDLGTEMSPEVDPLVP